MQKFRLLSVGIYLPVPPAMAGFNCITALHLFNNIYPNMTYPAYPNYQFPVVAFIDPYWMGTESSALDIASLQGLITQLLEQFKLERVYLYQESQSTTALHGLPVPCTQRVCARDAIDDGFELIRAMDLDMQQLATANAYGGFVVVSMDDRLALSIEHIKSHGICVMGLKSHNTNESEESIQRMSRVFDKMLELSSLPAPQATRATPSTITEATQVSSDAIDQAIAQWFLESDEMTRDGAIEFMGSRRGLPRHVDSRLLFLCSRIYGRELTEPEKFDLRGRFRRSAHELAYQAHA